MTMNAMPAETGFQERYDLFLDELGSDADAVGAITQLALEAGLLLERIFGEEAISSCMNGLYSSFQPLEGPNWKEELWRDFWTELPITLTLNDLLAYGKFGICIFAREDSSESELEDGLGERLETAEAFIKRAPVELWLPFGEHEPMTRIIQMSLARWALDHDRPVEAQGLALLGGVSWGRMRNMLSGKAAVFHAEDGMVPPHEASAWLEGRQDFYPSIWHTARPNESEADQEPNLDNEDPLFVPAARDGEVFHPGLLRSGHYTVGANGDETRYERFEDALEALTRMPTPRWRRPGKGNAPSWSLVTGVEWQRSTMSELNRIAQSMQAMRESGN